MSKRRKSKEGRISEKEQSTGIKFNLGLVRERKNKRDKVEERENKEAERLNKADEACGAEGPVATQPPIYAYSRRTSETGKVVPK